MDELQRTIEWHAGTVKMIDQRVLPLHYEIKTYTDYAGVAEAIHTMVIRGAPAIGAAAGLTIPIVVDRDGQPVTLDITPRTSGPVKIGIYMAPERVEQVVERYGPLEAVLKGAQETIAGVVGLITFLASAIFGLFTAAPMPEGGGLTGPIGIARMTGEIAREGIDKLLYLAAAISISLGTLNLLPIPALDGGRLVFVVAEWLRGKRIPPEREALVHAVGMISLLLLMAVVSYFDVAKWMQGISPLGGG